MPRLAAGLVTAGMLLVVGVSETPGQTVCATLTTTASGQPPVQQALEIAVRPVAGGPVIELVGQVVASGDLLWGPAALLPGGSSARVGLTIAASNLAQLRFVGLLVDLATAGGTGVFAQPDGPTGSATIQFAGCQ